MAFGTQKMTILHWCDNSYTQHSCLLDYASLERHVREEKEKEQEKEDRIRVLEKDFLNLVANNPPVIFSHAAIELDPWVNHFNSRSSFKESVIIPSSPGMLLPLMIRPTRFSSSSFEIEIKNPNKLALEKEKGTLKKLKSNEVFEKEKGIIALRKITRSKRLGFCFARRRCC